MNGYLPTKGYSKACCHELTRKFHYDSIKLKEKGVEYLKKYIKIISKYNKLESKQSVLVVIEEILIEAGEQGESLSEIYKILDAIGYKHQKSVIRGYMNRNIVGSLIKGGHNLWYRKEKGIYISKKFYKEPMLFSNAIVIDNEQ